MADPVDKAAELGKNAVAGTKSLLKTAFTLPAKIIGGTFKIVTSKPVLFGVAAASLTTLFLGALAAPAVATTVATLPQVTSLSTAFNATTGFVGACWSHGVPALQTAVGMVPAAA